MASTWNRLRYDLYAPIYDSVARGFRPQRRRAAELAALQPREEVLLLGAGTGLDLEVLPRHAGVTAVDLSGAMIRRLRRRAEAMGRPVEAHVMNAEALDLPRARFDCVLMNLVLAVVDDPVACAREAARVVKPEGRVVVFDKFLPEGARPSAPRRAANAVARLLATDINRQARPLLGQAGLRVIHDEPARFGGLFRIIVARPGFDEARR